MIGCLTILLIYSITSLLTPKMPTDITIWLANNQFAADLRSLWSLSDEDELSKEEYVEMLVESVGVSKINYQPLVILQEKGKDIYLPIWIGIAEMDAISEIIDEAEFDRPLMADLFYTTVGLLGGHVESIVINDLRDGIFYANITLNCGWKQNEIDARPSDAIAIALRFEAPIYVTRTVMDKAGVLLDEERHLN